MKKFTVNKKVLPNYGIYVESHRHGPDFKADMHSHTFASLYYIISGKGRCVVGQNEFELSSNTAVLLESDVVHQLIDKPNFPMTVLVVYFDVAVEKQNKQLLSKLYKKQVVSNISLHRCMTIRNQLRKMLDEQQSKAVDFSQAVKLNFAGILLQLKRSLSDIKTDKTGRSSDFRVQQVLSYVKERFYEPPSLAEAARLGALSTRQFSNICRKITNQSYLQYVNSLRINKSADLLENTSMSVAAISFETGFEDLSTFYRAFKRYRKTSPQDYRSKKLKRKQ